MPLTRARGVQKAVEPRRTRRLHVRSSEVDPSWLGTRLMFSSLAGKQRLVAEILSDSDDDSDDSLTSSSSDLSVPPSPKAKPAGSTTKA